MSFVSRVFFSLTLILFSKFESIFSQRDFLHDHSDNGAKYNANSIRSNADYFVDRSSKYLSKSQKVDEETVWGNSQISPSFHLLNGHSKENGIFWKFIHDPSSLISGSKSDMKQLLEGIGIFKPKDLKQCNDSGFDLITKLIKPAQRSKLMAIVDPIQAKHVYYVNSSRENIPFPYDKIREGQVLRFSCNHDIYFISQGERYWIRNTTVLGLLNKNIKDSIEIDCYDIDRLDNVAPISGTKKLVHSELFQEGRIIKPVWVKEECNYVSAGARYLIWGVKEAARLSSGEGEPPFRVDYDFKELLDVILPKISQEDAFPFQSICTGAMVKLKCGGDIFLIGRDSRVELSSMSQLVDYNMTQADLIHLDCSHLNKLSIIAPSKTELPYFPIQALFDGSNYRLSCEEKVVFQVRGSRSYKIESVSVAASVDGILNIDCVHQEMIDAVVPLREDFSPQFPVAAFTHGAVLRPLCNDSIYFVSGGSRHEIPNLHMLETLGGSIEDIILVSCSSLPILDSLILRRYIYDLNIPKELPYPVGGVKDGMVVRLRCDIGKNEYFVNDGYRHHLMNNEQLHLLNRTADNVTVIDCAHRSRLNTEAPLNEANLIFPLAVFQENALVRLKCSKDTHIVRSLIRHPATLKDYTALRRTPKDAILIECIHVDVLNYVLPIYSGTGPIPGKSDFPIDRIREGTIMRPRCGKLMFYIKNQKRIKLQDMRMFAELNKTLDDVVVTLCEHNDRLFNIIFPM